jgi:hypothetical protein
MVPQTHPKTIEKDTGMCPFPDQTVVDRYILNYKKMIVKA